MSWFSEAWLRLLGGVPAAANGLGALSEAFAPEEYPGGMEAWLLAQAPGQTSFSRVMRLRTRDGQTIPALVGFNRTLTRKRTLARVVGFACPLPEEAAAPAAPAAAAPAAPAAGAAQAAMGQGIFEEVLAALSEGVIGTDAQGSVLFANATAARVLRLPLEGLAGRPLDEVFALVDRQSGKTGDHPAERALSASGPLPLISDQSVVVAGADPVPVVWTARASYGPDGKPRGVVIVFRNPDEMGLTPEELIRANRFESLGLLAGGIAHDFNNLLTTILGGLSLAKDNHDSSKLADSEKACLTAKGLTKQLLMFTKGGSGTLTVCDSREILEDAVKIASAGSTAEISVQVPAGTGAVSVDRPQILQVFQNLIVNALQAMPPAPHKPRAAAQGRRTPTSRRARSNPCPRATTSSSRCATTGAGSSPSTWRRSGTRSSRRRSTGPASGWRPCCRSSASSAARSGFSRPSGRGPSSACSYRWPTSRSTCRPARRPSLRFGTGRVLFMDDDDQICALTASMLQSLDYKFDIAKNGEDAVVLYKRYLNIGRPYDAVIMDLTVVGGMGGEETFKILHELDPDVRAIVSSGYDNDDMARQYLDMGFCGYLTKPYRVTDLGQGAQGRPRLTGCAPTGAR